MSLHAEMPHTEMIETILLEALDASTSTATDVPLAQALREAFGLDPDKAPSAPGLAVVLADHLGRRLSAHLPDGPVEDSLVEGIILLAWSDLTAPLARPAADGPQLQMLAAAAGLKPGCPSLPSLIKDLAEIVTGRIEDIRNAAVEDFVCG